mmetsp:Transcript_3778/g.10408  ORF Transcript_3778/g.10408 Transcript_3778/m.10408 type:complete len:314 (+) Transcript_3778:128-1069(+)
MPIFLLSPAKMQNFAPCEETYARYLPRDLDLTQKILARCRQLSVSEIKKTMNVSDSIAHGAAESFELWESREGEAKPALYAYTGFAYRGLDAGQITKKEAEWLNDHLRIISGFYGALRPLDRIRPYRLEMAAKGIMGAGTMREFWTQRVTKRIGEDLAKLPKDQQFIVNLASEEYSRAVDFAALNVAVYTCHYKAPTIYAKFFRGMYIRHAGKGRYTTPQDLTTYRGDSGEFYVQKETEESDVKKSVRFPKGHFEIYFAKSGHPNPLETSAATRKKAKTRESVVSKPSKPAKRKSSSPPIANVKRPRRTKRGN